MKSQRKQSLMSPGCSHSELQPTADAGTPPRASGSPLGFKNTLEGRRPERLLVQVATQAGIGDADQCAVVLNLLSAARKVRQVLDSLVETDALSEAKVATLLTLYALEPVACTPADLAYHAEVSRSNMTDVLDDLQARGWIVRQPRSGDRGCTPVQLTNEGHQATQRTVHRILQVTSLLAADLGPAARRSLFDSCEQLRHRAQTLLAAV